MLLLTIVGGLAVGGCDSHDGLSVHGKVSFQGQAIEDGTVTFFPQGGEMGRPVSTSIENGAYAMTAQHGLSARTYRVEIQGYRKTGRQIPDLASPLPPNQKRALIDEKVPFLPEIYNDKSQLTADVSADGQEIDFALSQ